MARRLREGSRAVVVTHEAASPNVKRRVPLPNVCDQFGVVTRDPFTMLRELEVRFDWRRAGDSRQPHDDAP